MAKEISLQDLTIVQVAAKLGVTPALIHYHLDGRDELTSAIVNSFVQDMLEVWPTASGKWRPDLEAVASTIHQHYVAYPGIAAFFAGQNRFSLLLSALKYDKDSALFTFLERCFAAVHAVGLNADRTATYALLLLQFIHNSAHHTASHHWPGEQKNFRAHLLQLDPERFPHINLLRESYLYVAGDNAFQDGLKLIITGLAAERRSR